MTNSKCPSIYLLFSIFEGTQIFLTTGLERDGVLVSGEGSITLEGLLTALLLAEYPIRLPNKSPVPAPMRVPAVEFPFAVPMKFPPTPPAVAPIPPPRRTLSFKVEHDVRDKIETVTMRLRKRVFVGCSFCLRYWVEVRD